MFLFPVLFAVLISGTLQLELDQSTSDDDSFYPYQDNCDDFHWKILRALSRNTSNVIFSPSSLKLVLGILYEASSGATQKDFENSMFFTSKNDTRRKSAEYLDSILANRGQSGNMINLNTSIWMDSSVTLKNVYATKIKQNYNADTIYTNFSNPLETSDKINSWVAEATVGAIKKLTTPDELQGTIMLLANAIYFKGAWKYPFPENATCIGGFYVNPETKVYIPYMTTTNVFYYHESSNLEAKIIRLPYQGRKFSMMLILPNARGGLPALLDKIGRQTFYPELYSLSKKTVHVSIPKFIFKLKASFANILQNFGLRKMFQNSASFTGIVEGHSSVLRQLVVSDILQSSGIEVDEKGTTAFAATDVVIGNKIGIRESDFNASYPFLFRIQDDVSGTILFMGKVENPLEQESEIRKLPDDFEKLVHN